MTFYLYEHALFSSTCSNTHCKACKNSRHVIALADGDTITKVFQNEPYYEEYIVQLVENPYAGVNLSWVS